MTAPEFLRDRADAYRRHAPSMPPTIASDYEWIADELLVVAGLVVASDVWHERWTVAA